MPHPLPYTFGTIRNKKKSFKRSSIHLCPTPLQRFSYLPPSMHKFGPFFLHLFIFIFLQDQKKRKGFLIMILSPFRFFAKLCVPLRPICCKILNLCLLPYTATVPQSLTLHCRRRNVNKTNDFI